MALDDIITLIIRTIFSYIFLLIILKVMGKRELSQVSIFDVVIFLIMSELFSLALNDPDASILHFIIPVIVIAILELISSLLSLKFIKIRKFLEGKISFIIYKGEIDFKTMKKNRYNYEISTIISIDILFVFSGCECTTFCDRRKDKRIYTGWIYSLSGTLEWDGTNVLFHICRYSKRNFPLGR